MKLTKTDHQEQALVIDQRTKFLIREAMGAMLDHQVGSVEMRDEALQIKRFLESPESEDKPALFSRSYGIMMNCTECIGTGTQKLYHPDRNEDPTYIPCSTCKGEGQLCLEVIRKGYVPTENLRRKLAK